MIEVRYKARLGNNLFQYCLGRILAEELGFALRAGAIEGFPNTGQKVDGARHNAPEQTLKGQRIDLDGLIDDRSTRRIILDGWFQRYEYYRPYRDRIRTWLEFDSTVRVPCVEVDVVVHVRRTDYVQLGWSLPYSYFEQALERTLPPGGKVCVITDDRRDPFFRNFKRWGASFLSGTALQQMAAMTRAPRVVMSQSTFSWWPTFLGDPKLVVCPVPSFGAWSPHCEPSCLGINLIETDRFVCLECREPYIPTDAEARYQTLRVLKRRLILKINRLLRLALPVPPP
jgi:hypothetical protein